MKVGLVGLPGAGKSTVFSALSPLAKEGETLRSLDVPDPRVDRLAEIFHPRRKVYAKVDVEDLPGLGRDPRQLDRLMGRIRDVDALALVVRAFENPTYPYKEPKPSPARDLEQLTSQFQVADFVMLEGRIERLSKQVKKPTQSQEQDKLELQLLCRLKARLEEGEQLLDQELKGAEEELIRGFRFLTMKPSFVVVNLPDDGAGEEEALAALTPSGLEGLPLRGSLEAEIARLDPEDARIFMAEYGLKNTARERLLTALYKLLGLHSFLTAGEDECRAWTIRKGALALKAASVIHSDIARGFIRAEVVPASELMRLGGMREAKAAHALRLEGKEYVVQDGDVINFRFNV